MIIKYFINCIAVFDHQ